VFLELALRRKGLMLNFRGGKHRASERHGRRLFNLLLAFYFGVFVEVCLFLRKL
jgi:hypothetical protein